MLNFNFSDYHACVAEPQAVLSPPDEAGYSCNNLEMRWAGHPPDASEIPVYHWMISGWTSFISGGYSITYDTDHKQVAFDVTCPLASDNYIIAANLWCEADGAAMSKLHWKWKMRDGATLDASKLLRSVILQLNFSDDRPGIFVNPQPSDTEYTFNLDADEFAHLSIIYINARDRFGNEQGTRYMVH